MSNLTGTSLLNRYYLRKKAGSGGMADVYQAWDNLRSTRLAIKVLRRDLESNPRFTRMFNQEANIYRQLEHPNIVRIYGFERDGDLRFIIMDWVEGSSLGDVIAKKDQPYSPADVSAILGPLSSALHYAHNNQVFHCDVKPTNILLHNDGKVLLTDFGVARLAHHDAGGGTAPYMAPEQFQKGEIDARTDVYALGITIYQMLSGGNVPYTGNSSCSRGSTSRELIGWEHMNSELPPLEEQNREISPAVSKVIRTALAKEPGQRFQGVMDLREAFEHARIDKDHSRGTGETVLQSFSRNLGQRGQESVYRKLQERDRRSSGSRNQQAPRLYGRSGERQGEEITIPQQGMTIGRSSRNYIQLRERSVSRTHALLWITDQGVYIRDENSSLGTFVNNRRIHQPYRLQPGDIVQIGYYQFFEFQG